MNFNPGGMKVKVEPHELVIAAATGAVFGLLGYFLTRHIQGMVKRVV